MQVKSFPTAHEARAEDLREGVMRRARAPPPFNAFDDEPFTV
jgi:hypothetical protein